MIADTSIWIDYFLGKPGDDLELFRNRLNEGQVVMAPSVLSELLSSTAMPATVEKALLEIRFATPSSHFWQETGKLQRHLAKLGTHATLADCLVAQSCLEHKLPLLTRNRAIIKFGPKVGLNLLLIAQCG